MQLESVGEVIAVRRLYLDGEEPRTTQIVIEAGKPVKFPDSDDFYCPFRISGAGEEKIFYGGGIDAFQAIQEAFRIIGMYLYIRINPPLGYRLRWEGNLQGDLGFPRFQMGDPDQNSQL
jgi:hypothetical protein